MKRKAHDPTKKSAVALRYDKHKDSAPKVTAKGQGVIAENIIALAKQHAVPIQSDPDLVQILSHVDIDREIPAALYKVVAEMLAFVYQLNKNFKNRAAN
jgi:flagellar biosynthesis protein